MVRRSAALASVVLAAVLAVGLSTDAQDAGAQVAKILDRVEETRGAAFWDDVQALEEAGKSGLADVRTGLTRADGVARAAAASALYRLEFRDEALDALVKVARESKQPAARRTAARAAAFLVEGDAKLNRTQRADLAARLKKEAADADDEMSRLHFWRAAYSLTESMDSRRAVRDLFEKTARPEVKDEAALALAQMDLFSITRSHLATMAARGDENGRLARAYLKLNKLTDDLARQLEKAGPGSRRDYRMLDEILEKLKEFYYDPAKIDEKKLLEGAARGILGSLDPYSAYYDEKAIEELKKEGLEGHYGGIGARVAMRKDKGGTSWLTITEPIFSGPAYRHGLRSNDTITEVEGESTANREVGEIVRRMRGKPKTEVRLKVFRRGWTKEREFKILREEVQLETTVSELLPGGLAYVNYSTFGDLDDELKNKGSNIETQLTKLAGDGMKVLILDLRGNSGGYLRTARRIASMFLEEGQVIVTTKAQGREVERYLARARTENEDLSKAPRITVPMIVLVDEGSASASEILAGCLKDHKRALVVGERTFGKGSVQDLKYLKVADEKTAARITIAKWFLPLGASVEKEDKKEGGVEPDLKVTLPERDFWKELEFEKLRADGRVEDYAKKLYESDKALCERLAETDLGSIAAYPGVAELHASLDTRSTKEDLRELLRDYVRKAVQDGRQLAFRMDYQTDTQLQRAILEGCARAGVDPATIEKYAPFAAKKEPAK